MKHITIATMAAMSTFAFAQASFAQQANSLQLGDLFARCCGGRGNMVNAKVVHLGPGQGVGPGGFAIQLQVTTPDCCGSNFAEAVVTCNGSEMLDIPVNKLIRFTASGINNALPPTSNFGAFVEWKTPGGSQQNGFFTIANGGLTSIGTNSFKLRTGNGNGQIALGSTIEFLDFEVDGKCVSDTQTAFVNNVMIDTQPVMLNIQTEAAFCSGGSTG